MMRIRAEGSERIVAERDFKKCEAYGAKGARWQSQWEFTIPSPALSCAGLVFKLTNCYLLLKIFLPQKFSCSSPLQFINHLLGGFFVSKT